jgi:DNA-directed RNA polymerase specialized sigma subunit
MELDLTKHKVLSGKRHPNSKLTEKEVKLIRLLYGTDLTQKELASMFGVSRSSIDAIVNRRTWRDI